LPHLWDDADQAHGALQLDLEVLFSSAAMRRDRLAPQLISASNARHLYWTVAQMVTHHASGGCNLRAGDLIGTGTITADADGSGSLLELCSGGTQPFALANGERRTYLVDGDEITLRARAHRPGYASIGFGECRGAVVAA
jgi:fumarylacetoacetase